MSDTAVSAALAHLEAAMIEHDVRLDNLAQTIAIWPSLMERYDERLQLIVDKDSALLDLFHAEGAGHAAFGAIAEIYDLVRHIEAASAATADQVATMVAHDLQVRYDLSVLAQRAQRNFTFAVAGLAIGVVSLVGVLVVLGLLLQHLLATASVL